MIDGHWRARLTEVAAPALLVIAPLCLFGPFTIFSGNEAEFSAPFWVLVRPLLFTGAALAVALIALGLVVRETLFRPYVALLFALGLVLWIQGNLLVADYGAFTGAAIDWATESWRNPYEIALWIAVPVLAVAATKYTFPIAPFASGVLVALQAATLAVAAVSADSPTPAKWEGPSDAMFELSRKQNVIHVVLDGFQSDFFDDILAEERQTLDRSLSGAVFFADHAGAFPTTIASIPAMLTGRVYRNEGDLQAFTREIFQQGSLFKSLRAGGYRVDSVTEMHHDNESATNHFQLPRPYVTYSDYTAFTAWQLADLSLFRHAPHILRPAIYNEQSWRLQTLFGPVDTRTRRHHPVNGEVVLGELARKFTAATDEPVYKYIHVGIPHQPVAVNGNCEFIGVVRSTRASFKAQARCAIMRAAEILDRLKEIGVYDNTLVVLSSDHGIGFVSPKFKNDRRVPTRELAGLAGKAMALLVVKAPNSQGPVRISYAPTAITDIPATVLDALGVAHQLPGEPALKLAEDATRTRQWAFHDWKDQNWDAEYFEALDIMEINGRVMDGNNWSMVRSLYAPTAGPDARTRGVFPAQRSRSGFMYRWTSPRGFFHAPSDARRVELQIRSVAANPQTVTFTADDRVLQTLTLSDQSWITMKQTLPTPRSPEKNWLEIRVDPPHRGPRDPRLLGVQVRDLIFAR